MYFDYTTIFKKLPTGTPPLPEEEIKFNVETMNPKLLEGNFVLEVLEKNLTAVCNNPMLWAAPKVTNNNYRVGQIGQGSFCFADIYLDTKDFLNLKLNVSYRVRYRWHSTGAFKRFMLGSRNQRDLPHRCEYQFKNYNLMKDDISHSHAWALESRFEFRPESQPFKTFPPAPPAPWPVEDFVGYALKGQYENYTPYPAHEYAKAILDNKDISKVLPRKIQLEPKLMVITTRRRIHLVMDNEFGRISAQKGLGSTENYNQAILITLDSSKVYRPELLQVYFLTNKHKEHPMMDGRLKVRLNRQIKSNYLGEFSELEFEFERNILSAINTSSGEEYELEVVKGAFREDVKTVSGVVRGVFGEMGISTRSFGENKYLRAVKLLKLGR